MRKESRVILSNQIGIHENLESLCLRYNQNQYQRPMAEYSLQTVQEILSIAGNQEVILDMCCGVGESTYHLACEHPTIPIIGIDKSVDRLKRKSFFKKTAPDNMYLLRGELLDLWYLLAEERRLGNIKIKKQFILYPNPYPKKSDLKKRWHANPISPFIFQLSENIELRSNWKLYLEEFLYVSKKHNFSGAISSFIPDQCMTPFEKKYFESRQDLYKLEIKKASD